MNHWLLPDTHFGHSNMHKYCSRPKDFEERILANLEKFVQLEDVLIHLGDVCMGQDKYWHARLMEKCPCKRWLIRGNHDKKSYHWYLSHGWDFVGEAIQLQAMGQIVLLSHVPQKDQGYDLNIHGHFHNNDQKYHEPYLVARKNAKQLLLKLEHDYSPVMLRSLVK